VCDVARLRFHAVGYQRHVATRPSAVPQPLHWQCFVGRRCNVADGRCCHCTTTRNPPGTRTRTHTRGPARLQPVGPRVWVCTGMGTGSPRDTRGLPVPLPNPSNPAHPPQIPALPSMVIQIPIVPLNFRYHWQPPMDPNLAHRAIDGTKILAGLTPHWS
jgi:hypothetical protein